MARKPYISGMTTNPTLMRKAGVRDYCAFAREVIRTIRHAGEAMRNSIPDGRVEVTGMVSRLRRDTTDFATAVIDGIVRSRYGEAEQKVAVRLAPVPHQTAIEAYRTRQFLHVVGEARQGRVESVHSIEVVPRQRPVREEPPDLPGNGSTEEG